MSLGRKIARGVRVLLRREAADDELDLELQHYLDEATAAHEVAGLSPAEARRRARHDVGDSTAVREQVRDAGWENGLASLLFDLRFAGRMLRKSPVVTLVLVFVIALGSGAVATIFSAMNATVLRPLPGVAGLDRLTSIRQARLDGTAVEQGSYSYYTYLRDRATTLDGVAAWGRVSVTLSTGEGGRAIYANMVSASYFPLLGVTPALGRFFAADEDRTPASHPVIVVSHDYWTRQLGADPAAIGRPLTVNGRPFTLVGVAPADFHGIYTGMRPEAWLPLMMQPVLRPRSDLANSSWLWLFGRLRPGVGMPAAQQELTALAAARLGELGVAPGPRSLSAVRLAPLTGLPGGEGRQLLGFMSLLLAAAALVLLIGGVNVAAMLSARYIARDREMAVRAALGAGRARLLRQLLTEVLVLFLLGAGGGFLVAQAATAALEQLPLPGNIPVSLELSPDLRVLAFAVGVSLLSGLTFGLLPALRGARRDITSRLREDSAGSGTRRSPVMRALIVGQLALSFVLLVSAGLFARAFLSGQRIDPGFTIGNVEAAWLEPEAWGYDEARARAFYEALRARVSALPGVAAVSYTSRVPLMLSTSTDEITIGDQPPLSINTASVDTDYFAVLRLPLRHGRAFAAADDGRAARVAIVNETLARRAWPDGSAIGRTFRLRSTTITVVGIAADAKYASLDEATPAYVYFPLAQAWQPTQTLIVRTAGSPARLGPALQQAVLSLDPLLPQPRVSTLEAATAIVLLPQRAAAIVTAALGGVGLILAAVGLYGLMTFAASRRTREIGIRVAMGAPRAQLLRMMIGDGLRLAGLGIALGLALSIPATRFIAGWLFGVSPFDASAFLGMAAVLTVVSLVASYLPARRAAALDPLVALKGE